MGAEGQGREEAAREGPESVKEDTHLCGAAVRQILDAPGHDGLEPGEAGPGIPGGQKGIIPGAPPGTSLQ